MWPIVLLSGMLVLFQCIVFIGAYGWLIGLSVIAIGTVLGLLGAALIIYFDQKSYKKMKDKYIEKG